MPFDLVPLEASEQPNLIQFLVETFRADPKLISFRPDVVEWKYFIPHPDWPGPRSLAVKQGNQIVAHGGVWPVRLRTPAGDVTAAHLIDWAASRTSVGAGVFLLRKIAGLADILLTVGGSSDTRQLLPKLGYKPAGELRTYARVIRPWAHFVTTPQKNWKTPIKFLRNASSAMNRIPEPEQRWTSSPIASFSDPTLPADSPTMRKAVFSHRTAAGLNHLLRCPAAKFQGFQINYDGAAAGYFVIAKVGKQARIVDIQIGGDDPTSWLAACRLAARTAAEDAETCEIVVASSAPRTIEAWSQSGFVQRETDRLLSYDSRNRLAGSNLDLTLADGDQCFLSDPERPYFC